ncbi:MAG: helix-turn-helix domain-containing protein [Blastochloris sp.]|nr:helix-turn-helix domain-containing protein [Blastochloris sp.]
MLTHLVDNAGRTVQTVDLLRAVWGDGVYHVEYAKMYIYRLRARIGSQYIVTERGIGYRFEGVTGVKRPSYDYIYLA